MIEATCGACGTVNRISETDVPVGAKYLTCASCKSRVVLPAQASMNELTLGGTPPAGGNRGDIIDLADLPAPKKRSSALAGVERQPGRGGGPDPELLSAKPARAPVDLDDLLPPAPQPSQTSKDARRPATGISDLPVPRGPKGAIGVQPAAALQTVDDLPTPKSTTSGLSGRPSTRATIDDLPAPKAGAGFASGGPARPSSVSDLPAPKSARGMSDGAPRGPSEISDLPAPRSISGIGEARSATALSSVDDLPTPKGPSQGQGHGYGSAPTNRNDIEDLPAPKPAMRSPAARAPANPPATPPARPPVPTRASQQGIVDLPAPKVARPRQSPPSSAPVTLDDLPMPRAELPTPRSSRNDDDVDLPMPKPGGAELPAPLGYFDDLPMPASSNHPELPAPKGFFDDLPMPASSGNPDLPAPKGFFDDLPQSASSARQPAQVPAPKGFFDDLPQAASSARQPAQPPAPKGFFDDIPQSAASTRQPAQAPAPKGFFDNIPQAKKSTGLFDDLDQPPRAHIQVTSGAPAELDLAPPGPANAPSSYDDLDLSTPSAPPVRFDSSKKPAPPPPPPDGSALPPLIHNKPPVSLELEEPRIPTPKLVKKKTAAADRPSSVAKRKQQRIALFAVVGVAAAGGIGAMVYKRHAAAADKATEITDDLAAARAAMQSTATNHWQLALGNARKALDIDEDNAPAIGLAAEAAYAGALDDGTNAVARAAMARTLLAHARELELSDPAIDRALIVESIAAKQWDRAITKLQPLVTGNPKDSFLELYYGWALAGRGDTDGAIKAFDKAADANAGLKVAALYGRGTAKLASSDLAGARADFKEVLAAQKDHIGAQVGLAAALPALQASQQESDLLAILQRKDIDTADPRVRVEAWVLAGDAARRADRLDAARERYNKALAIAPNDVSATTGLAETELRDGKLPLANELITKAATAAPGDIQTQLVAAEIEIKLAKLDNAAERLKLLADSSRQLSTLDRAHLMLVQGNLLDARDDDAGALDAYEQAAKLAGDLDLAPTITAIGKLGKLQQKALDDKNPDKAAQYRDRVDALLGGLADKAATDPALALTLGTEYLDTGDVAKAEIWLRRSADARPKDPDAKFQLAKALIAKARASQTRFDDAIDQLRAAIEIDPSRADIGLELAKTYEDDGRDPDAGALYDKLLAQKDPSIELRARAGRFYDRRGDLDKAVAQGDQILALDPANAAGLYLRGEKLLAAGKLDDAKKSLQQAVDADHEPQYLDGLGRCAEKIAEATSDTKFQELALRSYEAAAEGASAMFNPRAGQGRIYVARGEWDKALKPLQDANQLQPENDEVLINMGTVLQKLGRDKDAIAWLVKANKDKPSFAASYHLGQMYREQNDTRGAAAAFEAAAAHAGEVAPPPDGPDPVADVYWELAQIYMSGTYSNYSAAKANFRKFLGRNPKNMAARVDEAKNLLATTLLNVQ